MQHINVICPHCLSRFQLDPSLRGQNMRCPNRSCREVFEVQESPEELRTVPKAPSPQQRSIPHDESHIQEMPPAAARDKGPRSGGANEPVPVLPASSVPEVIDWHAQLPPRRQPPGEPEPPRKTKPDKRRKARVEPAVEEVPEPVVPAAEAPPTGPVELPSGAWDAPPIRHPTRAQGADAAIAEGMPATHAAVEEYVPPRLGRHGWKITAVVLLLVAGVIGILAGTGYYIWTQRQITEDEQVTLARKAYDEHRYADAASAYATLVKDFPQSKDAGEYVFFKELSELQGSMTGLRQTLSRDRLDKVQDFLKEQKENPLLPEHVGDVGENLAKYLENVPSAAGNDPSPEVMDFLDEARKVLERVYRDYPKAIKSEERTKILAGFYSVRFAFAQAKQRRELIAELQQLIPNASAEPIKSAEAIKLAHLRLRQEARTQPGLVKDGGIEAILNQLYAGHREKIVYRPGPMPPIPAAPADESSSGLLIDANVGEIRDASTGDDRTILALARGVLYALSQRTGRVLWATRVGIDVTSLPLRVPATGGKPEMVLLVAGEARMLHALDVRDGSSMWKYALPAPCLGRPIVLDAHAYLPTTSGLVLEIDLATGQLVGRYDLGQRLTVGGARLEGTKLLFFPADELSTYILDEANQQCAGILYTEHAAGSLRGEPILIRADDNVGLPAGTNQLPPGFLLLGETAGLDAWELRAFSLPPAAPVVKPEPLQPEPRLPGWPWYPPYRDSEKIVQVTDAGALGLFGVRQPGGQDPAVFPLIGETGILDLSPWLPQTGGTFRSPVSRKQAQVVLCQEDVWLVAQDQLLRMQWTNDRANGPTMTPSPRWPAAVPVGSPIHAAQVDEMGSTLFLVTQPSRQATCQASAVDAATGQIRWQRQLGLVCRGEPIHFGKELLALDQGGGLFRFEPDKHPNRPDRPWQIVGNNYVAPAIDDTTPQSSYLVPAPDGTSALEVSLPTGSNQLLIRQYRPAQEDKPFNLQTYKQDLKPDLNLKSRPMLAGPPGLRGGNLLLPLTDKSLLALQLPPGAGIRPDPPNWRASNAPADAHGYVVWVGDDEFVTTNGVQGLTRWRWPANGPCQAIPNDRDADTPTTQLPANIVAEPVTMKGDNDKAPLQLFVADANGSLFLLDADNLQIQRRWNLNGKITAGPFVRGRYIACVVDSRRLVWIDPANERPLWEYKSGGDGIVGRPSIVASMVLVADQAGRFIGLDPASGRPFGQGFTLQGNVTPVCSPVAFGPDRAFAPLADGTILLLPLARLRNPLAGMIP